MSLANWCTIAGRSYFPRILYVTCLFTAHTYVHIISLIATICGSILQLGEGKYLAIERSSHSRERADGAEVSPHLYYCNIVTLNLPLYELTGMFRFVGDSDVQITWQFAATRQSCR